MSQFIWDSIQENLLDYTYVQAGTAFIQASMSKIQGLLKASPTVFKDLKLMKNTDQSV